MDKERETRLRKLLELYLKILERQPEDMITIIAVIMVYRELGDEDGESKYLPLLAEEALEARHPGADIADIGDLYLDSANLHAHRINEFLEYMNDGLAAGIQYEIAFRILGGSPNLFLEVFEDIERSGVPDLNLNLLMSCNLNWPNQEIVISLLARENLRNKLYSDFAKNGLEVYSSSPDDPGAQFIGLVSHLILQNQSAAGAISDQMLAENSVHQPRAAYLVKMADQGWDEDKIVQEAKLEKLLETLDQIIFLIAVGGNGTVK